MPVPKAKKIFFITTMRNKQNKTLIKNKKYYYSSIIKNLEKEKESLNMESIKIRNRIIVLCNNNIRLKLEFDDKLNKYQSLLFVSFFINILLLIILL